MVDILSPCIFLANIFSVWRFSAGPSQFTLELVGDGAMAEVQLTPTCGINGGLGKIVMPVHGDVCTSQVISIHIQLLQERQYYLKLDDSLRLLPQFRHNLFRSLKLLPSFDKFIYELASKNIFALIHKHNYYLSQKETYS